MCPVGADLGFRHLGRFDASGTDAGYLWVSRSGSPVRLSASAYHLLQAVRSGASFEGMAAALRRKHGRTVTAAQLESSYARLVEQLDRAADPPAARRGPSGFWLRCPFLRESVVERVASRLAVLFASWLVPAVVLVIATLSVSQLPFSRAAFLQPTVVLPAYALFVVSLLVHELGHAAACARFGVRPADIGFVIYLIYPAFYSDVTRAWRLDRRRRVVVDLGGVYFQLAVGAAYSLAFWATGWPALSAAVWMILLSCLVSLNPVLRCDGYWILADALGVTRLDRQPWRLLRLLGGRLLGRRRGRVWPWTFKTTVALAIYTPLAVGGWIYLLGRLLPQVWHRAWEYPGQVLTVARSVAARGAPEMDVLGSLLVSTFILGASILMILLVVQGRRARLGSAHPEV